MGSEIERKKKKKLQFIGENEKACVLRNLADKEAEQGKEAGKKL